MVAIVSGNNLGVSLSSLGTLAKWGSQGVSSQGRNGEQSYVNAATGNLVLQDFDDGLASYGNPFAALRTYNSQGVFNDDNGDNWSNGIYGQQIAVSGTLLVAGSTVLRTGRDGAQATYTFDAASQRYVSTAGAGAYDFFRYDAGAGHLVWTDGDSGQAEIYDASGSGRLLSSVDTSGNVLSYNYGANGLLSSVVDASGETAFYDYAGNNLTQIRTQVTDGGVTKTQTRVRYGYDAQNRLSTVMVDLSPEDNSVADGKVYVTTYTYDGASTRIASVGQSDGSSLSISYVQVGSTFKVASTTDGLGNVTSYTYDTSNRRTTVLDPLGFATVYSYDAAGQLTQVSGPAVNGIAQTVSYVYNGNGDVVQVVDALGHAVDMQYDANGNQVLQRDSAGNTITRTYNAQNQLLTETTYLTPDPDGAGAGLPTQAQTTRYVYDAAGKNLPRFVISPDGRVTELRYNAYGEKTSSIAYLAATYDVSALAPTAVPLEPALATWAAAQDKTQISRSDMRYDARGQLQGVTVWAVTDATGEGVANGAESVLHYTYDQSGKLLQSIDGRGTASSFTYDGLGRILTSVNGLNQTTVNSYDDAHNKATITSAAGLSTASVYDQAGRLVSVTQSSTGQNLSTISYAYDADGRLRMTQDASGVHAWMLYDAAGRKVADIDGNGSLLEYLYNQDNQLSGTIAYANAVDAAHLALLTDANGTPANIGLATIRPAATSSDQKNWRVYDSANRLVMTVDSKGAVTETRYDGASHVIAVISYANLINPGALSAAPTPADIQPVGSSDDRITRNFYDVDGLPTASLDAEGYLTELRYDSAGRLVGRTVYATATTAGLRASGTLAQLRAVSSAADAVTSLLLNHQGQVAGQVDAEGYLTENIYDANGKLTQTIRYANKVTAAINANSTVADLRPMASAQDMVTSSVYDVLNRVAETRNGEGTVTRYTYDTQGNLLQTSTAADTTEVRTVTARYDIQGRLTGQLTPAGSALLTGNETQAQLDAIWAQYGVSYSYDAAGRKLSSTDQNGNKTLYFYDVDGHLTHTVNALGEVTESQYNALGQLTATIQLATRINTSGLTGGLETTASLNVFAAARNSTLDSKTSFTYGVTGKLAGTVDALGNVSSWSYDAFGEAIGHLQGIGGGQSVGETIAYDHRGLQIGSTLDAGGINAVSSVKYDAFGRVISSTDANGNVRTQQYDRLGRVVVSTDPLNASVSSTYDAFDRVLSKTDALGNVTTYAYDKQARSVSITTPENITIVTQRNRSGQTVSVTDGSGNVTTYSYDKNGNLVSTVSALTTTSSRYDEAGRLIETTDANGNKVAISYDAANRVLTRTVDAAGLNLITRYAYDAKGQQISVTDPNGTVTQFTYDLKGQLLRQVVDASGLDLSTLYSYDGRGKTLSVTSSGGTQTKYSYDKLGRRILEQLDPNGLNLTKSYAYDKNGNVISSTDANGYQTRYVYDADDQLIYTVDPLGYVQRSDYDAAGHVVRTVSYANAINVANLSNALTLGQIQARIVASQAGDTIVNRLFDKDGRLVATVREISGISGEVSKYVYDANNNLTETIVYANRITLANWVRGTMPAPLADAAHDADTRTVYDQLNRAIYSVDASGAVTAQKYDGNGNVIERTSYAKAIASSTAMTTAALGAAVAVVADAVRDMQVRNVYDAANRVTWSVNGVGAVTQRIYDADGNVIKYVAYATTVAHGALASSVVASANDRMTDTVWDAASRQVFQIDALGNVEQVVYDKNGNATRHIGYATAIAAPTLGAKATVASVMSALHADAVHDRTSQAAYDMANRLVLAVDAAGAVVENTYDATGNVVQSKSYSRTIAVSGLSATASPQEIRNLLSTDAVNDRIVRKVFDGDGRAVFTVDALGYVSRNEYDVAGRVTRNVQYVLAIPADTAPTLAAIQVAIHPDSTHDRVNSFVYDNAGRLTASTDPLGASESYTYNALGEKLSFTNKLGALWKYDYDAAGRLISETTPQVAITAVTQDANGSLVVAPAQSGSASIITKMSYDALGNLLTRTEAAGRTEERTTTYEYDALGHQVKTIYPAVGVYNASADNLVVNGATGLATRTDTIQTLYSVVTYDAFGDAVANRDVAGSMSYKAYDKLGRVSYDVDALGYVTGYTRNAWGDTTRLVRYAAATTLVNSNPASLGNATISAALNAAGVDHGSDRNLLNEYDNLGRLVTVTEPQTFVYDADAGAGAQYFIAGKTTRNVYNAFGDLAQVALLKNAVTNTWIYTNNYYNKSSQQIATVDALGYLTTQAFDGAGNVLAHTEFANAVTAWDGKNPSASAPQATVSSDDRTTVYAFDQSNRKLSETRVSVEYSTSGNGTSMRGNLVTSYAYDAVGNLTRTTDAAGSSTYSYYDALGRVTAVAAPTRSSTTDGNALMPLTVFQRDAYGNVVVRIDYAGSGAASASTYTLPTASAQDRTTLTQFDRFGHATQVTDSGGVNHYSSYDARGNIAKEWQAVTGNDGVAHTLFKVHQYDKLGHETHVIDPASTTVLQGGLQVGVGSSSHVSTDESSTTTFTGTNTVNLSWAGLIDPTAGNVRVQVDYQTISTYVYIGTDEAGNPITSGNVAQAASRTQYFAAGSVAGGASLSWDDGSAAVGGISQLSYIRVWQQDASGNWIIKWQGGPAQANGSGIATVTQAQAGVIDTASEYNAFGEVVRKGVNGGRDEYFDYDNGGNLWRTNSGDGIDKVSLRDLQGDVTSTIQSAGSGRGNINLRTYGSVDEIAALSDVRRTDTKYDVLGHAVQQLQPQRLDATGSVVVRPGYAQASVTGSSTMTTDESHQDGIWAGVNSVSLSWSSLAGLGGGDIKVEIDYAAAVYTTHLGGGGIIGNDEYGNPIYARDEYGNIIGYDAQVGGAMHTHSQIVTADQGASGISMSWYDGATGGDGGISNVTGLRVYKKDVSGVWQEVIQRSSFGYSGSTVEVAAPVDPNTGVEFQIRPAGTAGNVGWTSVPLTNFGDSLRFDSGAYSAGNYEYRVVATTAGSAPRITASGTLALTSPTLTVIGTAQSFGSAGTGVLAWLSPGSGVTQILRLRPAGSNAAWETRTVSARGNGYDGADLNNLAAGNYEYELLWVHAGESVPYAHATGQITQTAAVPPRLVPAVGTPVVAGVVLAAGDSSSTALTAIRWPLSSGLTGATFQYRLQGSTTWSTLPITTNGSGASATQQVIIAALPPGNYEYELIVTTSGNPPLSHATGNFSVYPQGAGHFETRSVPVQVPVTITPPDPAQFIIGWTGQTPAYGAPVVLGHDSTGKVIFGQGYSATVTYDANGIPTYGPVVASGYQVYHTETHTETYPVTVVVGYTPIYARDEFGNVISNESGPVITGYDPVYGTQYQTRQVNVQVPTTVYPDDPAKYLINAHATAPIYNSTVVAGYDPAGAPIFKKGYGLVNGVVKAIPYTETHPETHTETYPVTVVVDYSPIYVYDEYGNVVGVSGYNPVYGTQYQTRQVTVQVTTTITPPDPANYIDVTSKPVYSNVVATYDASGNPTFKTGYSLVNGVVKATPYAGTQTQYQNQQFWVDGTIPAPTMTVTTPPYQAAYTIPGVAAQFNSSTTTAANSGIISQGGTAVTTPPTSNNAGDPNAALNAVNHPYGVFNFALPAGLFAAVLAGKVLTYSATLADGTALPSWLTIDPSTGQFSGQPIQPLTGVLALTIKATGPDGASASTIINLPLTPTSATPVLTQQIADQVAQAGTQLQLPLPQGLFKETIAGNTLRYSAALANGAALPSWLHIDPVTGALSGLPGNGDAGSQVIVITATDSGGLSASTSLHLQVNAAYQAATATGTTVNLGTPAGQAVQLSLPGNLFSATVAGDTLTYSATMADGSPLPAWLNFDPSTGLFSGLPLNSNIGTFNLRITATDVAGKTANAALALQVNSNATRAALVEVVKTTPDAGNPAIPRKTEVDRFDPVSGNMLELEKWDPVTGKMVEFDQWDAVTGRKISLQKFDATSGKATELHVWDAQSGHEIEFTKLDPTSGRKLEVHKWDARTAEKTLLELFDAGTGAMTQLDTWDPVTLQQTSYAGWDSVTGKQNEIDRWDAASGTKLMFQTFDPNTGRALELHEMDPVSGAEVRFTQWDAGTGLVVKFVQYDAISGNAVLYERFDTSTGRLLELDTFDATLGTIIGATKWDAASGKQTELNRWDAATGTKTLLEKFDATDGGIRESLSWDATTGAQTSYDQWDSTTGKQLQVNRYALNGQKTLMEKYDGASGRLLERYIWDQYTGTMTEAAIWDGATGHQTELNQWSRANGQITLAERFDAASGNLTLLYAWDAISRSMTQSGTWDAITGKQLELDQWDATTGRKTLYESFDANGKVTQLNQWDAATGNALGLPNWNTVLNGQPAVAPVADGWVRPIVNQKSDRWGNVVEISDPRSAYWKTTYRYNADNKMVQQVQPDSQGNTSAASPVTQLYYDQLGRQVAVKDANGNVNGMVYDAGGNLVQERHADGGIVNYAYNAFGNKIKMVDAMGNVVSYNYDKLNNLLKTTRGVVAVYTVDGNNNVQLQDTRAITESATYDQAGRKLSQTNGNGETIRYVYDLGGNVIQTMQPLGQVTRAAFDLHGHKIAEVDPDNYATTWSYDYFGQLLSHQDLGGAKYNYTYDNARQLLTQTNTRGQSLAYRYDAAGQVIRIDDYAIGQTTIYSYDLAGDRVQEKTLQGGVVYQDNHLAYDELKRLRWTGDSRVTVNFTYDLVGNRSRVMTHVINVSDQTQDSDRWYAYDAMNRQTLVDGYNAAGAIGAAQGHRITYDKNGNRLTDTSWGNNVVVHPGSSTVAGYDEYGNPLRDESGNIIYNTTPTTYSTSVGEATEVYTYDALNRLTMSAKNGVVFDYRDYDGADRLLQTGTGGTLSREYLQALNNNSTGDGSDTKISRFDADGRIVHQRVIAGYGSAKYDIDYTSYDQAGNVLAYNLTNHEDNNNVNYYSYSLQRFEGYKPGTTYVNGPSTSGSSTNSYDVNGNLVAISDSTKSANNRSFVNDIAGHALYVNQGGNVERQLVVNGEVLGRFGAGINPDNPTDSNGNPIFTGINEFNFGYQTINGDYPTSSPGMVVVAAGDTLQSIARGAYGDSQLWYTIAEANGLANNSDLRVGQTLTIPNRANTIHNDSNTFKPYDPSKITGSTTPNLPAPPPADDGGGCGLASIITIIVVIVVSAFTMGAALGLMGVTGGIAGAGFGELVAAGFIAGAAGSIAGQLTGMALGIQDSFDWKGVAISAVTQAVTAGVGKYVPDVSTIEAVNDAARAAISSAVTQGVEVATGLQKSFNWVGVAAAAAGAGVSTAVGEALNLNSIGTQGISVEGVFKQTLSGFAGGVTSSLIQGGRINVGQIAADAFGNALGNGIAAEIKAPSRQERELQAQEDARDAAMAQVAGATPVSRGGINYSLAAGMGSSQGFKAGGGEGFAYGNNRASNNADAEIDFLHSEKASYQAGDFDKRDVTQSADTLSSLFKRNYGYEASPRELIQYANYNNLSSPHDVSSNREIISPSLDALGDISVSDAQMRNYLARDNQYQQLFKERASLALVMDSNPALASMPAIPDSTRANPYNVVSPATAGGYSGDAGGIKADPGLWSSLGNILSSELPLGQKLSMAYDNAKFYYRGSERAQGALQVMGGAGEVVAAGGLAEVPPVAAMVGLHGIDNVLTGINRVWSGNPDRTVTYSIGENLTGSSRIASDIDNGIGFISIPASAGSFVNAVSGVKFSSTYSGDVYAADFVGPKKFETFWRGDSTQRTEFLSSMAESRGVSETKSFISSFDDTAYQIRATNHSYSSNGSPYISITPDYNVAEYFARGEAQNQLGWVTKFEVPSGNVAEDFAKYNSFSEFNQRINPKIGRMEQEYLVPGGIDSRYITQQFRVGKR